MGKHHSEAANRAQLWLFTSGLALVAVAVLVGVFWPAVFPWFLVVPLEAFGLALAMWNRPRLPRTSGPDALTEPAEAEALDPARDATPAGR